MANKKNPLRPYEQMGVMFTDKSGNDDQADCPFCGKERKFHVNPAKEQWICSAGDCGRSGNTRTFLGQWHEFCLDETTDEHYAELSANRGGIPPAAFRYWGVALNPLTGEWLIPSYNASGRLQDLRRKLAKSRKGGLHGVAGCPNNLWGAQVLADPAKAGWPVDIAEGEWDGIALSWLHRKLGKKRVVVAVPGCNVFKEEWWPLFKGRDVTWWFDHDEAGAKDSLKHSRKLRKIAASQKFCKWPDKVEDKYDVRDYVCEHALNGHARMASKNLYAMLVDEHWMAGEETATGGEGVAEREPIVRPEENLTLKQALRVYRQELIMSQDMEDAFRVISAVVLGNQLPGDPLWMYLVGPPSGGKTELLMSLAKVPDVSYHSSVSAKSMMSGYKMPGNQDPSLIPKLIGRVAVFKDWTEVLSAHESEINALGGLMRGAYDGHIKRQWGNGMEHEYTGTFNVLAGVTNMIHSFNDSLMGERFLKFQLVEMSQREQQQLIHKVLSTAVDMSRNERLQDAACGFLNRDVRLPPPPLEYWVLKKINSLARFVAQLRSTVPWKRDGMDKFLAYEPTAEVGVRLAKQFSKLGQAIAIVNGSRTVDAKAYALVHRVAMNTAIGWPQKVLSELLIAGPGTVDHLAKETRMDQQFLRRVLRDMEVMGMVVKKKQKTEEKDPFGRTPYDWYVSRVTLKLCEEVEFNAYDRPETESIAAAGA